MRYKRSVTSIGADFYFCLCVLASSLSSTIPSPLPSPLGAEVWGLFYSTLPYVILAHFRKEKSVFLSMVTLVDKVMYFSRYELMLIVTNFNLRSQFFWL